MTSSTYGTLQGDASPSPPKSYRLSKVAKIALALIACGAGAAVIAHPGTRETTTSFVLDAYNSLSNPNDLSDKGPSGGAAPAESTLPLKDKVHQLNARVTALVARVQVV